MDGKWQQAEKPVLTVQSRAVAYGDGCFETLRSYSGKFLRFNEHLRRLGRAMEYLQLSSPDGLEERPLRGSIGKLLDRNGLTDTDSVVRIQVWREGGRGFEIPEDGVTHFAVTASALPEISESIKLATVATRRIPSVALNPGFKLSNSINYIRAAAEASQSGADDALMLTTEGFVSETTIANIFWMDGNTVFTPSQSCDILPGITRGILIDLIRGESDIGLEEGAFYPDHLLESETVWVCNSVREIVPVISIDKQEFSALHPVFDRIVRSFKFYVTETLE